MAVLSFYVYLYIISATLMLCQAETFKTIPYKNCKSQFEIINVEATECPGNFRYCPFKKGTEPRIRITFKPNRKVEKLTTYVQAKITSIFVPFVVDDDDACKAGNLTCPLIPGKTYYYSDAVKILDSYPEIQVHVNWVVKEDDNESNKRDLCIIFLAKVVE